MALIPCTECGGQVSTRALSCPHCGCPTSEMKPVTPSPSKQVSSVHAAVPIKTEPKVQVGIAPLRSDEEGIVRHARPVKDVPVRASRSTSAAAIHKQEDPSKNLNCLQCGDKVGVADIQCPSCHVLITKHYCSYCSELIPDHSGVCPLCGKEDREHFTYASRPVGKIIATAAISVLFFIFAASLVPGHRVKMQSQVSPKEAVQSEPPSQAVEVREDKQNQPTTAVASTVVQNTIPETTAAAPEVKSALPAPPQQVPVPEAKSLPPQKVVSAATTSLTRKSEPAAVAVPAAAEVRQDAIPADVPVRTGTVQIERAKAAHQLNNQGYMLITQGRLVEAIPVLERSIRTFPDGTKDPYYRVALSNLARALQMAHRSNLPVAELKKTLELRKATQSEDHWHVVARTVFTAPANDDDTDESEE